VLLTRLYLRNFRVYESELDLELPPGLVGVYGPNGSGKSTLLEAIVWTLWGRARTAKEDIRSSGVGGDCVTEIEFEHEGHLYMIRRAIAGAAATVRAEAHCDGLMVSEGVRDAARYLHSVLGMDDTAFRASVFAEQKQLAAFSTQTPAERRRLVLQLLGITPLDSARDAARREARATSEQHQRLRAMLPDLDQLTVEAADADARAGAAEADATDADQAAEAAAGRADQAAETFRRLDTVRQEYDNLVTQGTAAAGELRSATAAVVGLERELTELDADARRLETIEPDARGAADIEHRLNLVRAVAEAARGATAVTTGGEPPLPDDDGAEAATRLATDAQAALAELDGRLRSATAEVERARQLAQRSAQLSGEAACPLCGQALGDAFARVQEHRADEVAAAQARVTELARLREVAAGEASRAAERAADAARRLRQARQLRQHWEQAVSRRSDAEQRWRRAVAALAGAEPALAHQAAGGQPAGPAPGTAGHLPPDPAPADDAAARLGRELERRRQAEAAAARLRTRLERRPVVAANLESARTVMAEVEDRVIALRDKVRGLGFDPAALEAAQRSRDDLAAAAGVAQRAARDARLRAVEERARAAAEARRLADARVQHDQLAQLDTDSRHLGRLAELLSAFRNTVVASVGPRLAVQAAELFSELTDHEYEHLDVDPETYQLKISDGGHLYGLERFSGSEVDLANLALRVAISEHIRFQSGGSVGLLVLDEVFGPLDEDRKARMLLALERLRSRFRQILVVTHDSEIKEQLPSAIEVVKRPGRRATARVLM
jgi:exonuclease SbcC